jgi:hypothetical protein
MAGTLAEDAKVVIEVSFSYHSPGVAASACFSARRFEHSQYSPRDCWIVLLGLERCSRQKNSRSFYAYPERLE